ncbi:Ubiquitin fusion degradation protein 4 [Pleurotus pulmonarius]|nr:Ubiquitin fusion degradation protein 4 [Pleurotus pulmonarius]
MDLLSDEHQEAAHSASSSIVRQQSASTSTNQQTESRNLRSSTRAKPTNRKIKGKQPEDQDQTPLVTPQVPESSSRSTRSSQRTKRSADTALAKGKGKEVEQPRASKRSRKPTNPPAAPLTISEPPKDLKGKKRAAPDPSSEEEDTAGPSKRPRTGYSLRSKSSTTNPSVMPRKPRPTVTKGKAAMKTKAMAMAGSSRVADDEDDVEMLDPEYRQESDPVVEGDAEKVQDEDDHDDENHGHELDDDDDEEDDRDDGDGIVPANEDGSSSRPPDEASALSVFGDFRQFGSYMMSLSSRLKTMLTNIKPTADPTTRMITLQELSELLSISTEDTLAGSFPVEQFVRELVRILGGQGADEDEDHDGDEEPQDEDAALAAALAMSAGGAYQGDENLEAQVLACRCLANLMEALPGVAHTVVYHGAIPVLCSKLIEISYIDLAEQTLSTLEKISEEFPSSIVREGGLAALLNYLDFFSIAVQRTALQAACNCCRNISSDHFTQIRGVWPIIRNCLSYSDQRLVEFASLCVIRVIDSYHRSSIEHLETLVDKDLIRAVNSLLLPAGGSPLIAANTFTLLLRALATSARASPKIALTLLEADIVDTLYQILTGVLPSAGQRGSEQGDSAGGQGLGGGLADMTVMENLAHRPKEQIEEALSLVSELMPPIPKDGVFDHKSYTEKSLARMMKAKVKADRAAAKQALQAPLVAAGLIVAAPSPAPSAPEAQEGTPGPSAPSDSQPPEGDDASASTTPPKEPAPDRTELLRSKPEVTDRFMQLMVPILVDVYAASVITPVRVKTLTGLLKAVSFLDAEGLNKVLACVPVASFASSILSSKDHPSLVIGALQLVELFLIKVPESYKPTFRREGVLHEIETLVQRTLTTSKSKEKDKDKDKESSESSTPDPPSASVQSSSAHTVPGFKKLSSLALDPDDAITLRARVIRFKYLAGDEQRDGDKHFDALRRIVERISVRDATEKDLQKALRELADLFTSSPTSVSSFELLQTGVVDGLLQFTADEDRTTTTKRRREIFLDAFTGRKSKGHSNGQTPFTVIVKKLQESLTRMESFDVVTVSQGVDDSKRSSPSLLARQLRLRLVASEESDSPRNIHNIVVSIHAIATFQALHDYLRPRITSLLSNTSRLSGMLAALQAHGLAGAADLAASKPSSSTPADEPQPSSSVGRRRSQRLSAKKAGTSGQTSNDAEGSASVDGPAQEAIMTEDHQGNDTSSSIAAQQAEPLPGDMLDSDFQADFSEDDVDAELFDEEGDNNGAEKTVNLSVVEDGSKVVAQTPEGTRVATPSIKEATPASLSRGGSSKASYAAALKAKPTDWHLEFSMDDQPLPLDLTIYGAIHQHEMRKKTGALPPSLIWQGIYTVKFKKVAGPAPSTESRAEEIANKSRSVNPILTSMQEDAPHSKILRLLRVLHQINTLEVERSIPVNDQRTLSEAAFINNKLTAKLTRQLEEPMIVASSCLPDWALDLPQHFPFLFPFATRYNFLQSTSFGYARLILKWQSQQTRNQDSSRRDEGIGFLGRLQRQKVRISRKHILESAVKVFELYGSSSSILEVEYFEEAGTGLGPTLEFYSLVSREFARKDLKIWRDSDTSGTGMYVQHPTGLYPAPLSAEDIASDGGHKRTHILRVIGQFVAKAMLDSRIIDLHFNKVFLKLVLGEEVPLTIQTLKLVDSGLASSLAKLQNMVGKRQGSTDKLSRKLALLDSVNIEDLALDFTVPGYDIELMPGGRDKAVTSDNVEEYIQAVLETIIGRGAQVQVKAFREGFSKVFPITDLQTFSADELVMLFGNSDEDWSVETLQEALKADHGFNSDSRSIHDLIAVMSEFDAPTRRDYLQFITGSPKLPIGGFRGLNPPLTVVRKPHEAPFTADDYLPSVMTCVNYLKLPEYSSKAVLREKVRVAMKEGVGSFHLS